MLEKRGFVMRMSVSVPTIEWVDSAIMQALAKGVPPYAAMKFNPITPSDTGYADSEVEFTWLVEGDDS